MSKLQQYLAYASQHPEQFTNPPGSLMTILFDVEQIVAVETLMEQRLLTNGATQEQAYEWSRVGVAFQDQYLFVVRDAVRFGDGSLGTYIRLIEPAESTAGVAMLPVYDGRILLIQHFRHATRSWSWEIPRGFGERGYSPEENARRELREEIHGDITQIVPLGAAQPDAGLSAGTIAFFCVTLRSYGAPDLAEGISSIRLATVQEFEEDIASGVIVDGFTLSAYAKAKASNLI